MQLVFSIGPWLMELINPPPRDSLSLVQKIWRVLLVTVTLVTLCIIFALLSSLGLFAWERSREFVEGTPQLRNGLTILVVSAIVNTACIATLLQIKKLDQKMIPKATIEIEMTVPPRRSR
jgi:hypothetical protein